MTAKTSVTTQKITRAGLVAALTAAPAAGDVIDTGYRALVVNNASGASITVTVATTPVIDGLALTSLAVSVAAATTAYIGPFPLNTFGQLSGAVDSGGNDQGRAYVTYSAVTSVTRAVIGF